MNCKNCGSTVGVGEKFCTNCGAVISSESEVAENNNVAPMPQPIPNVVPGVNVPQPVVNNVNQEPASFNGQDDNKKNNTPFIIIGVILGVIIVGLVVALILLGTNKNASRSNYNNNSYSTTTPSGNTNPTEVSNENTYNYYGLALVIPNGFMTQEDEGTLYFMNQTTGAILNIEILSGSLEDAQTVAEQSKEQLTASGYANVSVDTYTSPKGLGYVEIRATEGDVGYGFVFMDLGGGYVAYFAAYDYDRIGKESYINYMDTIVSKIASSSSSTFSSNKTTSVSEFKISTIDSSLID